jgi:transcriptional regulator with XRE-family HTH domain
MSIATESFALTPFGNLCKQGRVALGMTMREMAKLVGASPLTVSQIEQGKIALPAHYAVLVMQVLGLDTDDVEAALAQTDPTYQLNRTSPSKYGSQT